APVAGALAHARCAHAGRAAGPAHRSPLGHREQRIVKQPIETRQIDAFVDGELDLATQLEIERQMRVDDALRERVEHARQLQSALREQADYHEIPAALRERLGVLVGREPAPAAAAARVTARVERWFGW